MSSAINLDLGPNVLAYPTQVDGKKVCVLSPRTANNYEIQERVRHFMKAQGRDCRICGGCPVGRAS